MKHILLNLLGSLAAIAVLEPSLSNVFAQDSAFTYQGRLADNGSPANGVYDFTFQAFDAVAAGNSIGGSVTVNGVGVTNGLFTAVVDLSSAPFTGPARWLQIGVSSNGMGNFTALAPRQPLTPSPYAIYAHTAGTVTNGAIANPQLADNSVSAGKIQIGAIVTDHIASGSVVKSLNGLTDTVSLTQGANVTINTVGNSLQISAPAGGLNLPFSGSAASSSSIFTLTNSGTGPVAVFQGKVGIGKLLPTHNLHIAAPGPAIALQDTNPSSQQTGYVSYRDNGNVERAWVGFGTAGDPDFSIVNARPSGDIVLSPFSGNVGIGTPAPAAKLQVIGDIRLGPNGQFFAISGQENLRIIRGGVTETGGITAPTGFTVSSPTTGVYTITFDTAFVTRPYLTVTANYVGFPVICVTHLITTTSAQVRVYRLDNAALENSAFEFIAIGPR